MCWPVLEHRPDSAGQHVEQLVPDGGREPTARRIIVVRLGRRPGSGCKVGEQTGEQAPAKTSETQHSCEFPGEIR